MQITITTNGDRMIISDDGLTPNPEAVIEILSHAVGLMLTNVSDKLTMYEVAQEAISRYIDMGDFLYNLPEESLN